MGSAPPRPLYPVLWSRAGMVYILSSEGMILAVDEPQESDVWVLDKVEAEG